MTRIKWKIGFHEILDVVIIWLALLMTRIIKLCYSNHTVHDSNHEVMKTSGFSSDLLGSNHVVHNSNHDFSPESNHIVHESNPRNGFLICFRSWSKLLFHLTQSINVLMARIKHHFHSFLWIISSTYINHFPLSLVIIIKNDYSDDNHNCKTFSKKLENLLSKNIFCHLSFASEPSSNSNNININCFPILRECEIYCIKGLLFINVYEVLEL